jgi:hypothetical protein
MEGTWIEIAAVVVGFLIRLALPLLLTLLLAWSLRRLDARWQREAAEEAAGAVAAATGATAPRACWEIRQCGAEQRQACPAYNRPDTPCWEVFQSNSHPSRKCLKCIVWRQWHPETAARLT